jgi:23S rRNA A1618 N6-methylase RlmF
MMTDEIQKEDIVFIEYNGIGRPFQVYTKDLTGYDFFYKNGWIQCEWCSGNIRPFLNELTDKWKAKKKLKVWFNEDFRPTNNTLEKTKLLTNDEISEMGYVIVNEPKWIEEIIYAIRSY